ncbi:ATP-binding protein [Microtetraspora fusca]|uniref:ATP-binding protein n=1 Tax=Microtetraspora fusca TaxID=1997 RepID=A0ABW6V7I5_MICFU|nr:ATP-binding protein [Microtetraspora fusca]
MTIDIATAGVRNVPSTTLFSARRSWAVNWDRSQAPAEAPRGPEPSEDFTATWELPQRLSSTCMARRVTRARLSAWGLPGETIDIAELLVSEVAGNALRHTHGPVQLSLSLADGLLRCEVEDADRNPPRLRDPGPDDERGRGLNILRQLACCWGAVPTFTGKVVWFELPADSKF